MYSRLFLSSVSVELLPVKSGTGGDLSSSAFLSLVSRIGSHRFARTSIGRDRSENERTRGRFLFLSFLWLPSLFSRARAITLVCEGSGPLAIGMKVGSCVEMESPGPRLYTHLPTRDGQDRARGPRPSSPIEPPGGAPLLVLFSSPFLDSTYLISLLVLRLLLSFSSSYTASCISASSLSLFFFLSRSLLPSDLGLLADFFAPFCSGPRRLCPVPHKSSSSRSSGTDS